MKSLRLILILFLVWTIQSCMIKRSPNMDFANKLDITEGTEVVSINVPRFLVKSFIASKIKEIKKEDPALALAVKKIQKIKLMVLSGDSASNLQTKFNNYLVQNNFEELMSLHSEGAKISINTKMKGNKVKNLMLGIMDEGDQVFVDIKSDLDLEELNHLIAEYEEKQVSKGSTIK